MVSPRHESLIGYVRRGGKITVKLAVSDTAGKISIEHDTNCLIKYIFVFIKVLLT